MQVDRMFSAEAAITIKQNKKLRGDIFTIKEWWRAGKGRQEKEEVRTRIWKQIIDEHLKLLTMPRNILFYKNYIKKIIKTLLKN